MTTVIDPWAITDHDEAQALPSHGEVAHPQRLARSGTRTRQAVRNRRIGRRPGRPRRPTVAVARGAPRRSSTPHARTCRAGPDRLAPLHDHAHRAPHRGTTRVDRTPQHPPRTDHNVGALTAPQAPPPGASASPSRGVGRVPFFLPVSGRVGAPRAAAGLATCGGHRSLAPHLFAVSRGRSLIGRGPDRSTHARVELRRPSDLFGPMPARPWRCRAGERGPKTLLRSARTLRG